MAVCQALTRIGGGWIFLNRTTLLFSQRNRAAVIQDVKAQVPILTRNSNAPRRGEGIFCLLFVAAWTKSKASGGTRPAGYDLGLNFPQKTTPNLPIPPL